MGQHIELSFRVSHALLLTFVIGAVTGGFMMGTIQGVTGTPTGAADSGAQDQQQAGSDNGGNGGNNGGDTVAVSNINTSSEPSLGDQNADVTVVEFSDYQCPFCRQFQQQTLDRLKKNYIDTGKVRFVYKDFPIPQLGHDQAVLMAEAALCAGDQDKYWEMHDKMFNEQQELSPRGTASFSADKVTQWASDLDLNMDTFNQCLDSDKYKSEVQNDQQEGRNLGVSGTPTFFIYGSGDSTATKLVGAQPYSRFQSMIDQKLNGGGTQESGGTQEPDKTIEVSGTEYSFSPSTITVQKDQTVRVEFTNTGQIPHNLRIPSLGVGSQVIQGSQTDSFTFTAPEEGTYPINTECTLPGHAENGMVGKVVVK
jgi:protein-disulfide isomerase